jgi:hypothetical protein
MNAWLPGVRGVAYRGEDWVVLRGSRGSDARPGVCRRRGGREADGGRASAGAGEGRAGIGTTLEERGVERAQLGRLGNGGLDVLARGREGRREAGGGGGRGSGLCAGHGVMATGTERVKGGPTAAGDGDPRN